MFRFKIVYEPNQLTINDISYCFLLTVYLGDTEIFIGRFDSLEKINVIIREYLEIS